MPCFFKPYMHHNCLCIMPCLCRGCLLYCLLSFQCCFFGLVPIMSRLWGFVRLRPFVFFVDSFLLPCGISVKMTMPSKSLLCLLASCSLYCYAYAAIPTTCLSCLPYCHVKPLTHLVLANRCLAMLTLCSTPLILLLVAGEDWSLFLVGTWRCCSLLEHCLLVGISQYLLFN